MGSQEEKSWGSRQGGGKVQREIEREREKRRQRGLARVSIRPGQYEMGSGDGSRRCFILFIFDGSILGIYRRRPRLSFYCCYCC